MKHMHTQKGFAFPAIIAVLGIILLGGIGYAVMKKPMGEDMEKSDAMMHKDSVLTNEEKEHMEMEGMMKKDGGEWTKEEMEKMEKDEMMKGHATGTMMMDHGTGTMMKKDDAMMKKDDAMMQKPADMGMMYKGAVIAGKSAPLLDFNKADYDAAVKSGKLVTLFFYANWCPLCKAEFPKMMEAFNGYAGSDVIGFRVNYKDDQTDADEKALAAEFGVSYQHTKVFVKNGVKVLKAPDSWDTARYTAEIAKNK